MLTRRTQILLDEDRYERLRRQAEASGSSVAALIRAAIDRTYPVVDAERRRAARELLGAIESDQRPEPQPEWGELKGEMLDEFAGTGDGDR